MTPFKIAIIGAGCVGFTKKLVSDILKVPEFAGVEFALTDINAHNLDMIAQIIRRIVEVNGLPARVTATTDRRAALDGRALRDELRAHRRARGLRRRHRASRSSTASTSASATRSAPAASCTASAASRRCSTSARDIREVAEPGALFLNYANPMAMNDLGRARVWRRQDRRPLPRRAERRTGRSPASSACRWPSVDIVCAGINHQTWYIDIRVNGAQDRHATSCSPPSSAHPVYLPAGEGPHRRAEALRLLLDRVQRPPQRIPALVPQAPRRDHAAGSTCPTGSTARPAATCATAPRAATGSRPTSRTSWRRPASRSPSTSAPTSTAATSSRRWRPGASIAATSTCATAASSPTCPTTAIIESPGFVDRFGINMVEGVDLPLACAATCSASGQRAADGRRGGGDRRRRRC